MKTFRHPTPRLIGLFLSICLFGQVISLHPAVAQDRDALPGSQEDERPPHMQFQPPADASRLEDFVPPGIAMTRFTTDNAQMLTAQVNAGRGDVFTYNERVAVVIEGNTFLDQTAVQFRDLPVPANAPPAEPETTPDLNTTEPLTSTTKLSRERVADEPLEPAATATAVFTATFPITQTAIITGFDVITAATSITPSRSLTHTVSSLASDDMLPRNTVENPLEKTDLLRFQLEVVQSNGRALDEFPQPARIVVDLRTLTQNLNPVYSRYFLAYQDPADPLVWHEVPIVVHQRTGLISAEVFHFSTWAAGVRPERWNPSWTPPAVSTFSGAVTYSYPIELPPGRNGLQPDVTLSYSSRALDGRIRDGESGPIGDGWSLSQISVMRVGVKLEAPWGYPWSLHPDKFRLVLNGTGHELFPAAGSNTTTETVVRYYVKDAPGYRLERNYATNTPNIDGIYWILIGPNGTRYRLGYTADAEEWQWVGHGSHLTIQGHPGHANLYSAVAWHVDTVTDSFGNQMTYHYQTWDTDEDIEWWNTDHWTTFDLKTRKTRINTIKYNFPTRVTSLPVANTVAQLTSTPATRVEFRSKGEESLITSIYLFHGSGAGPINEYRINSAVSWASSPGCINYDKSPAEERKNQTRVVNSIQRFVGTDFNPVYDDPGTAKLPATTFSHDYRRHFTQDNKACFQFYYMTGYQNGYGGSVNFTYVSDNRQVGIYKHNGYNNYDWPTIGFNYSVSEMQQSDGRNQPVKTTYVYTQPCYAQWGAVPSGAVNCAEPNAPDEYGNIVGYQKTTQTLYDYNNQTALSKQITTFSQNATNSIGRPTQVDVQTGSSVLLASTTHQYESVSINGVANMFTYTVETKNYQYGGGNTLSTKTRYEYNTANQGNNQYGNLTHVREYDSADANVNSPYRTTVRTYYPNSTNWLVGLAGAEGVYAGNVTTLLNGAWYYYDNDTNNATPPTQGKLQRSRAFIPTTACAGSGCVYGFKTIDTTYQYDVYGNQTQITTHSGYGARNFNSSWVQVYNAYATNARSTFITYESGYNLYPISTKNPLNQVTTFEIYGFNGVALSGFQKQPGLLKQVSGPDGVTTKYEYDPFGRLHAVYDGNTSYNGTAFAGFNNTAPWDGDPVTLYRYWDNTWNNATTFLNPAGNAPFIITEQQRPGSWPQPANSSSGFAFDDQTFYDGFGRPIQTRSIWHWVQSQDKSREIISSTAYNAQGQVSCQTAPYDVDYYSDRGKTWPASPFVTDACTSKPRTTTTYDALSRPLVITAPDGSTTTTSYSVINNLTINGFNRFQVTAVTNANGQKVEQLTNPRGQLTRVREYNGGTLYANTTYAYDLLGNLGSVTDHAGNVTGMSYDNFGRKVSMNDPDMGAWSYTYDAAGNLTEQLDANQKRLCFTYDKLDRLTNKWYDSDTIPGCDTQLAYYDYFSSGTGKVGRPSEIRWSADSTQNRETFNYDTLGRLTTHTRIVDGRSYTMTTSGFDALHRPTTVTYPNGQTAVTTFDREGANSLTNSGAALVSDVRYNGMGQMTYLQRSSGSIHTTYLYHPQNDGSGGGTGDSNFRLKTIQHGGAGTGDTWPDFTYEYDKVGNITKLTTLSTAGTDTQSFGYDHLNRLVSASGSGVAPTYSDAYAYNQIGNITSFDGAAYTYSAAHKHAVATANGVTYSYDANGNMTFRDASGAANDYTQNFNVENELTSVVNNGNTTSFTYDAAGIRVKAVAPNGVITDYPFPGYEVENPTGSATVRLTFSIAGQAVALKVMGSSTATYYLYNDHLGSVAAMSTSSGGVVAGSTARYYPFGGWRTEPTAGLTDRGFTGHLHNNLGSGADNLGLVYMQARWYLPALGRFISADTLVPDPANPQSYNRYSYVFNQPLVYNDPSGHCPWCIGAIGGAIVGAAVGYGAQVYQNMQNGQSFTAALTTDIDAGKIVAGAVVGAVVGGTLGAAAPALTTYGTVAVAQVQTTAVAAAAAHPTAAAVVGGVAETAVECSMTGGGCGIVDYAAGALTAGAAHRLSAPGASSSPGTALTQYDPEFASRSLLRQNYPGATGYGVTPGGRTVSAHAAERVALGGPGRPATNLTVVDNILDSGNQVRFDPVRNTIQVRATQLPGRPYVVVSGSDPNHIVTVMAPR